MKKYFPLLTLALLICFSGMAAAPALKVKLDLADHSKTMLCEVTVPRNIPGKKLFCELSIIPAGKNVPEDQRQVLKKYPVPASRLLKIKQPLDLVERTRYVARFRILNSKGRELAVTDQPFATAPDPNWKDFTGGMPDGTVPAPWTKVERNGSEVSVWGRKFVFGSSPLPERLFSQEQELLQGKSNLVLDPAPEKWELVKWEDVDDTTVRSVWRGQIDKNHAYSATVDVYFDGVVRFDLELPGGITVKRFALEFPVKKSVARTLHRGPWGFGGYKTSYHVKSTPDYHPIRPQLFLYNNDIGFGWFDGMEFDWPLKQPNKALEVLPRKDAVLFRVNYIDGATKLNKSRRYSCGLQPLPVRPLPREEKGLRMCYAFNYTAVDTTAWKGTADYLPKGNIKTEQGTAEMSVRFDFDPKTHKKEEFFFETTHGPLIFRAGWSPHYGLFAQVYERYQSRAIVATKLNPEQGKWVHMAVSWGNEIALYMDGKKIGSTQWKGSSSAFPAMIHAGGVNVAVDGFRISDIARHEFVIDQAPTADKNTLLLDNFEKFIYCNGRRATAPEKISEAAEAGYLTPDANLGEGRWGQGLQPMNVEPRNLIAGLRHYGIDTFCFHASQYTDEAMAGMYIAEPERMRRIVDDIHNNGGRAVIYINNSLSNLDRAWDTHKEDWLITPRGYPFIAAIRPHEKSFQACPRSDYINYFFWRLDALFKEYQLDGAFLDGRMYSKCDNALHGCGVVNFEGKRVPQRNVWDGRLKAWRLYNIIESNGGYGEQHKSSIWDAPTCFFWDAAWEGEQFMLQSVKPGQKRLDLLPLEAMHEHINGRVYGLPARYTAYLEQPFNAVENCTFSFVHATTWTMTYRIHEAAFTAPYWHALDKFGADNWNFRGYWEKVPPAAEVPDELLKVSAHVKEDSALAIIANFNEEKPFVEGKIRFQWDKLGLTGPFRACDAFSGEEIPVDGQTIEVKVKSFRQSWIIFEKIAQ